TLGADTVAVTAERFQKMHAAAGKGGFAIESAQAMFGPVFTGPTKGHRPAIRLSPGVRPRIAEIHCCGLLSAFGGTIFD
ncbi:MAG: hypothetical protein R6X05_04150, partial [Desulfobacterales bacterium]